MGNELISVIVPIYNLKDYIGKCVESILHQTYRNLEIILVDDGSTDGSGEIIEKIKEKDDRIKVIRKENGGVSSARNAGLDIAQGEYIGFVDGDDRIEPDMYEFLHDTLVANDADIACCGWRRGENCETKKESKLQILRGDEKCVQFALEKSVSFGVCDKLFKKKIIGKIRFNTEISIGEDFLFGFSVFYDAQKVVVYNLGKYHYIKRNDSVTEGMKENTFDHFRVLHILEKQYGHNQALNKIFKDRFVRMSIMILKNITCYNVFEEKYGEIRKKLLVEKRHVFLTSNTLSLKDKMTVLLIWLANPVFKAIVNYKKKKSKRQ